VTVQPVPRLALTRFVAVGDSITYGVLRPNCPGGFLDTPAGLPAHLADLGLLLAAADVPNSYPTKLQDRLAQRYTDQTPVVVNEGVPGETTAAAIARLPGVLTVHQAEVLLLQEGANNVNSNDPASIPPLIRDLRTMIRTARDRGVRVFLGTLLPQRTGACRAYAPTLIEPANTQIRSLAAAEGATLVDLYQPFIGQLDALLGADGLHPNEAGYEQMAQTFLDVVQHELEK
jgi:lysophospholipase L1-like esterase